MDWASDEWRNKHHSAFTTPKEDVYTGDEEDSVSDDDPRAQGYLRLKDHSSDSEVEYGEEVDQRQYPTDTVHDEEEEAESSGSEDGAAYYADDNRLDKSHSHSHDSLPNTSSSGSDVTGSMSGMQLYGTEATEYCATGTAGDSDDEKGIKLGGDHDEEYPVDSSSSETSPREGIGRVAHYSRNLGQQPVDQVIDFGRYSRPVRSSAYTYTGYGSITSQPDSRRQLERGSTATADVRSAEQVTIDMSDADLNEHTGLIPGKTLATSRRRDSSPILARVDHGYDDRHPHDTSRPHYDTDHDSLEAQYPGRQQKEQYGSSHKPIQEPATEFEKKKERRDRKIWKKEKIYKTPKIDGNVGNKDLDELLAFIETKPADGNAAAPTGEQSKKRKEKRPKDNSKEPPALQNRKKKNNSEPVELRGSGKAGLVINAMGAGGDYKDSVSHPPQSSPNEAKKTMMNGYGESGPPIVGPVKTAVVIEAEEAPPGVHRPASPEPPQQSPPSPRPSEPTAVVTTSITNNEVPVVDHETSSITTWQNIDVSYMVDLNNFVYDDDIMITLSPEPEEEFKVVGKKKKLKEKPPPAVTEKPKPSPFTAATSSRPLRPTTKTVPSPIEAKKVVAAKPIDNSLKHQQPPVVGSTDTAATNEYDLSEVSFPSLSMDKSSANTTTVNPAVPAAQPPKVATVAPFTWAKIASKPDSGKAESTERKVTEFDQSADYAEREVITSVTENASNDKPKTSETIVNKPGSSYANGRVSDDESSLMPVSPNVTIAVGPTTGTATAPVVAQTVKRESPPPAPEVEQQPPKSVRPKVVEFLDRPSSLKGTPKIEFGFSLGEDENHHPAIEFGFSVDKSLEREEFVTAPDAASQQTLQQLLEMKGNGAYTPLPPRSGFAITQKKVVRILCEEWSRTLKQCDSPDKSGRFVFWTEDLDKCVDSTAQTPLNVD